MGFQSVAYDVVGHSIGCGGHVKVCMCQGTGDALLGAMVERCESMMLIDVGKRFKNAETRMTHRFQNPCGLQMNFFGVISTCKYIACISVELT